MACNNVGQQGIKKLVKNIKKMCLIFTAKRMEREIFFYFVNLKRKCK